MLIGKDMMEVKVLYQGNGILGLEKPEGVLIDAYPWYPGVPSIVFGLREQAGKGLLEEYDLKNIYAVYALEPEVTGVALIASNKESSRYLRNEFGSDQMIFRFIFLSKSQLGKSSVACDLPIAKHFTQEKAVISNKTGKKCKTLFRLLAAQGGYQVWEAQTTYLRMHQIRIHAMESGIGIVGDDLYGEVEEKVALEFKKGSKKSVVQDGLVEGLCLHLSSVEWGGERIRIYSELSNKMRALFEKYHLATAV